MPFNDQLYVAESKLLVSSSDSATPGRGLFSRNGFKKDVFVGYFQGELIDREERDKRATMGLSCYVLQFNENKFLDCYSAHRLGLCICSFANSPTHLRPEQGKACCRANCKVKFDNNYNRVSLWTTGTVKKGEELLYSYGRSFNFDVPPTPSYSFDRNLLGLWRSTPTQAVWKKNVEGTGFCGYLSICQALRKDDKMFQMRLAADRKEVCDVIRNTLIPDVSPHYKVQLQKVLRIITNLGEEDLSRTPGLPDKDWLSCDISGGNRGNFLRNTLKFFLWQVSTENDRNSQTGGPDFYSYGHNQEDPGEELYGFRQQMRYSRWRDRYMGSDYKHIFFKDSHFFLGEYDNAFMWTQFKSAFDNLVARVVELIDDPIAAALSRMVQGKRKARVVVTSLQSSSDDDDDDDDE